MSRPSRTSLVFALSAASLALGLAPAAAQVPVGPGSLSGVWQAGASWNNPAGQPATNLGSLRTPERARVVKMINGEEPPMLPWAADKLNERIKRSQAGDPEDLTLTHCLPAMPAMLLGGPYPVQIIESAGQVTMLFEEQNHFRSIYLNAKQPEDPDPAYMGHSVGRWEGDTLVVDTIALVEETPVDRVGMPHSDQLHLTERYKRTGADTMEVLITVDDPKTFARPWQARANYRLTPAGTRITEYVCSNNRDD